ncbi:hypothetical protein A2473_04105 [candidate division WWE3 bacterium RIFOXYC2_FULL_42_13]|uniref:Uncharacterized protein n=2 Tax=Katanobacteria TaxID=422282 RepID=A0A3D0ZQT7_UNCKA|nr:MAG: hypothetical protein A2245_01375 [candidate division WWE3 bacterium RIFOXYA2_FULL_43_12]OGC64606.1 MAG: hypothetical protein A2274_03230 [candidate division WWE3 bacterium RIFOXYA12_FULL_43_11]OGC72960.1 MAG: hypothetical protein A2473_04105 [candidate division WWE3 bacterium RIFOXYC2_FULL_42_13]OGC75824.1 MAG: hypothetical protein A2547_00560 [candidate division WWE3 bacterium RIFOXYD2_FULL_43_10]HCC42645.1 hypothetical protein [candidate division WWE3 bacterium]
MRSFHHYEVHFQMLATLLGENLATTAFDRTQAWDTIHSELIHIQYLRKEVTMSFYEQFVVVLERSDESTCDGKCTYDADTSGTQTDYESC